MKFNVEILRPEVSGLRMTKRDVTLSVAKNLT